MGWFSFFILLTVIFIFVFLVKKSKRDAVRIYIRPSNSGSVYRYPGILPIEAKIAITYQDAFGEMSEREISVNSFDGVNYLNAYCFKRNAPRTFRVDRIRNCVDTETGEVIQNIPLYLKNKLNNNL